tara:strand:- start:3665 stop:3802 length:138 start_codon:yes stop_codon:yes gene_type:complete
MEIKEDSFFMYLDALKLVRNSHVKKAHKPSSRAIFIENYRLLIID